MTPHGIYTPKRILVVGAALACILSAAIVLGLCAGSSNHGLSDIARALMGIDSADPMISTIVWRIRFPRVMLAVLTGAALALGGLVCQTLYKNILAEPYILGISGGAGLGAVIGILLGFPRFPAVSLFAFAGSTATLLIVLYMASRKLSTTMDSLLLAGVMVNIFCSSAIMFLMSIVHDSRLHNILFWLMGDLSTAETGQVSMLFLVLLPCFALLFFLARPLNLLLMGDELATNMGLNVRLVSRTLMFATSLMVSAVVCLTGLLGFVGLVAPHLLRLLFGPDHRILVPLSILGGATYLVLCDILARALPSQGEIPVGVVTALIGAPALIFLLQRSRT